jgi:predicted metal-dependent enzyme (double-stranded beta helix superfamily)
MRPRGSHRVKPGGIDRVSPTVGDVHVVSNALADRASVSIHVYGANIGAVSRHVFDPETGAPKPFVSGYHNAVLPNFWDRSSEVRARIQQ